METPHIEKKPRITAARLAAHEKRIAALEERLTNEKKELERRKEIFAFRTVKKDRIERTKMLIALGLRFEKRMHEESVAWLRSLLSDFRSDLAELGDTGNQKERRNIERCIAACNAALDAALQKFSVSKEG